MLLLTRSIPQDLQVSIWNYAYYMFLIHIRIDATDLYSTLDSELPWPVRR